MHKPHSHAFFSKMSQKIKIKYFTTSFGGGHKCHLSCEYDRVYQTTQYDTQSIGSLFLKKRLRALFCKKKKKIRKLQTYVSRCPVSDTLSNENRYIYIHFKKDLSNYMVFLYIFLIGGVWKG